MRILIIDDSNAKISALKAVASRAIPDCQMTIRRSFQKALKQLEREKYDIVLLDMTIPTTERSDGRFEGRIRYFGGREILGEMDLLEHEAKVVIVTQFDRFDDGNETIEYAELMEKLKLEFPKNLVGSVFYTSISNNWVVEIETMLKQIAER